MSRWRAVVFDLDDTLYPERDFIASGFEAVAAWAEGRLGVGCIEGKAELMSLFERGIRGDTFDQWLAARGLAPDKELIATMVRVYREHQPRLRPYAEVSPLLARLRPRYRLGLVSDGPLAMQRRKLAALGLRDEFEAVVLSDEWGPEAWKPSPGPFEEVLERLGVASRRAVYVADNPGKDFLGARRAGMSSVRLRLPLGLYYGREPETPEHAPEIEVGNFAELSEVLEARA